MCDLDHTDPINVVLVLPNKSTSKTYSQLRLLAAVTVALAAQCIAGEGYSTPFPTELLARSRVVSPAISNAVVPRFHGRSVYLSVS